MITNTIKAAVLIACMATTAAADDLTEACGNMGKYAEAIMIARQAGNPMSEVIEAAQAAAQVHATATHWEATPLGNMMVAK